MQIKSSQILSYRLFLFLTVICYTQVSAQDSPVENYFQQVGDYADIYNGRLETAYNTLQYKDLPYYKSVDYTDATIIYKNTVYPGQKVRLDLYKEQLILLSPGKRYGIILNPQHVGKVYMYDKTFVWLVPPKESGLRDGYYIQLWEGKEIQLFSKVDYSVQEDKSSRRTYYYFEQKTRHYLSYNDRYYAVKNRASFTRIFKQHKKQINKYYRNSRLNFKQDGDKSLTSLAEYCEGLLSLQNTQ